LKFDLILSINEKVREKNWMFVKPYASSFGITYCFNTVCNKSDSFTFQNVVACRCCCCDHKAILGPCLFLTFYGRKQSIQNPFEVNLTIVGV
jgi:hypothetical protein